jgi:hypothetical protein
MTCRIASITQLNNRPKPVLEAGLKVLSLIEILSWSIRHVGNTPPHHNDSF